MRLPATVTPGRRGTWIPWLLVGLFGVVVAVNATMIWLAATSWTGLDSERAYEDGLAYNRNLAAAEAQAKLGWRVKIEVRQLHDLDAELSVAAADAAGQPLSGLAVTAALTRPTAEGHDRTLLLEPVGPGEWRTRFTAPLPGVWDVHLRLEGGSALWVGDHRVVLR